MVDKAIHKHLDNRLDIQDEASGMIDEALGSLNLKALLKAPAAELARVAHIAMGVVEAHAQDAANEGIRFAKAVLEKGPVKIEPSDDPKLNEGDAPGGS